MTLARVAAVAAMLSAVTTLGLILLPWLMPPAADLAGRMARVELPAYRLRAWVALVHPLLAFAAALGVAAALRPGAPGRAAGGLAGFALWAATEAAQQCLTLFAFDPWRRAWLAGDAAVRETMPLRVALYDGLWDAAYLLLLIGFVAGCAFYAAALVGRRGLAGVVGGFYAAATLLTLSILSRELGGPALPATVEPWLYLAIQPAGRLLTGLWLWREKTAPLYRRP